RKVFAPEHGFRGEADAGERIHDQRDARTGLPVASLYGKSKKPTAAQLADVDVLLFDIQDVGARFYTYISTLHLVMEAALEHQKRLIVLDRPNPNGFYVDGPVLDTAFRSFVGMHPVPIVHGMTVGEFARMINGEGWLKGGMRCDLTVIECEGWDHKGFYPLPVPPSPNLPNMSAVYLYPSLCLFEGTIVSVGRGTSKPFQCVGYPGNPVGGHRFTPRAMPGAKEPPYKGRECTGLDLEAYGAFQSRMDRRISLQWLIGLYRSSPRKGEFFTPFFDKLAGGKGLREAIVRGDEEEAIRASWRDGLEAFKRMRRKHLLYPDFE
ncbi:MAG: exo-beta-N-acetylmuramidase NamZ domain-containing protein, partial [Flavobacteriales bacterium]